LLRQRPEVDAARLGGIASASAARPRCSSRAAALTSRRGQLPRRALDQGAGQGGSVKAAILSCTGADDPMIPADQVVAFEEEMRAAKADWQVILYGNTLHSFTNPEADGSLNPAILYNEKTDKRSWAAMRDFFQEKFGA